jgi:hypothetical protein
MQCLLVSKLILPPQLKEAGTNEIQFAKPKRGKPFAEIRPNEFLPLHFLILIVLAGSDCLSAKLDFKYDIGI